MAAAVASPKATKRSAKRLASLPEPKHRPKAHVRNMKSRSIPPPEPKANKSRSSRNLSLPSSSSTQPTHAPLAPVRKAADDAQPKPPPFIPPTAAAPSVNGMIHRPTLDPALLQDGTPVSPPGLLREEDTTFRRDVSYMTAYAAQLADASPPYQLPRPGAHASPPPTLGSSPFRAPSPTIPRLWEDTFMLMGASQRGDAVSPQLTLTFNPAGTPQHKFGPICPICLRLFSEMPVSTLACGHQFHTFCISRWLSINATCPYCRTAVSPMSPSKSPNLSDSPARTLNMDPLPAQSSAPPEPLALPPMPPGPVPPLPNPPFLPQPTDSAMLALPSLPPAFMDGFFSLPPAPLPLPPPHGPAPEPQYTYTAPNTPAPATQPTTEVAGSPWAARPPEYSYYYVEHPFTLPPFDPGWTPASATSSTSSSASASAIHTPARTYAGDVLTSEPPSVARHASPDPFLMDHPYSRHPTPPLSFLFNTPTLPLPITSAAASHTHLTTTLPPTLTPPPVTVTTHTHHPTFA
eukprot:EG_transcript_9251